jgi:catechol 2,3-dioxygenase-like lactoylglutathione lyase family enzyme
MAGSPLPLLGTFHEASIAVKDVREAVEFYERLGFSHATTNDTLAHPYGVLTDGRLFLGLHQRRGASPVLTFVRPGVAESVPAFAAAGLALSICRTGEHVFNEIGLLDPFGHALAVLEARTYSPVPRAHAEVSLCGDFSEVSLPVTDFAAAREFWEALGFVAAEEVREPYPHLPLTSDYLDVSFHHPGACARAMLVFRDPEMRARIARLGELGVPLSPLAPRGAAHGPAHGPALLESPDGTPLLLIESER